MPPLHSNSWALFGSLQHLFRTPNLLPQISSDVLVGWVLLPKGGEGVVAQVSQPMHPLRSAMQRLANQRAPTPQTPQTPIWVSEKDTLLFEASLKQEENLLIVWAPGREAFSPSNCVYVASPSVVRLLSWRGKAHQGIAEQRLAHDLLGVI